MAWAVQWLQVTAKNKQAFTIVQQELPADLNIFTATTGPFDFPLACISFYSIHLYLKFIAIEILGAAVHRSFFCSPEFFLSHSYAPPYCFWMQLWLLHHSDRSFLLLSLGHWLTCTEQRELACLSGMILVSFARMIIAVLQQRSVNFLGSHHY